MGIFKDIATGPLGDVTIGAFEALDNIAIRDARNNATIANDSLRKENEAFKNTELAFKNKGQIVNILKQNPEAFGISAGDLTTDQIAERLAGFMFNSERTIFENNDFNKVKLGVANFLARNPGQGFELTDPYVASADLFDKEKQLNAAKLSEISKMPKADKLLFNIEEAQAEVPDPEIITDKLTKVAALSAKGYGILRSFPTSAEGMTNLKFMQTNIIVANARTLFPNDNVKRMDFINKKLYDNNIDPLESIKFQSPVTFRSMITILDEKARGTASQITQLNNAFAQADNDEQRQQITRQLDNLMLDQYKLINNLSSDAPMIIAGKDRSLVYREGQPDMQFAIPEAAEGYVPSVDNKGQVIVELANGQTQKLDLELLVNEPDNLKVLPQSTQNYVNQIKDNLFRDGDMIKPTRQMFEDGPEGDKAFRDFLGIYNTLGQEDLLTDQLPPRTSIIDPAEEKEKIKQEFEAEKAKAKDADISKFKVVDPNEIKVEELPPANQENKQNTDQEPDVFEESGVEPEFQSANFKFRNIDQSYLVSQWSKNYQTSNSMVKRINANKKLILGSNDAIPVDAAKQIDLVASAFDGDNNFNKEQIVEILGAIGFIESDGYKYKKQGLNEIGDGKGVARSYWQIEPSTAESILDQNLNAMKNNRNQFLGANFEKLFKNKYANQIGNKSALEYFASLNRRELSDLLLKDGLFAASIAAHKVITTFDPFNSKGA